MFEFLNNKMIPYKIRARVNIPSKVLEEVNKMKENGEDINDEMSFVKDQKFLSSFHTGFVDMFHNSIVELEYGKEGNWFYIPLSEIRKKEDYSKYYYHFEPAGIKSDYLTDIEVIEWGIPNKNGDGIGSSFNKPYLLTLIFENHKNITLNIEKPCLYKIKEVFDKIKESYSNTFLHSISFSSNDITYDIVKENNYSRHKITSTKKVKGKIVVNSDSDLIEDINASSKNILFTIEQKTLF